MKERGDIIEEFLALASAACPTFTHEVALRVETQLRRKYGGSEEYIAKTPSQQRRAKQAAVTEASRSGRVVLAAERHGISRATMYRLLAKKPG